MLDIENAKLKKDVLLLQKEVLTLQKQRLLDLSQAQQIEFFFIYIHVYNPLNRVAYILRPSEPLK